MSNPPRLMTIPTSPPAAPDRLLDQELIDRVLLGDRLAARALYEAHVGAVHRIAFRLSGDADVANDLTQDTFVRAFRQLPSFRGDAAFGTWLHRVAVRTSINGLRKVRRLRKAEVDLTLLDNHGTWDRPRDSQLQQRLQRAMDTLPDAQRQTLVLHDLEGYTHQEIGRMLGVAEGTSKSRLSQARSALRKQLADLAPRSPEHSESRHGPTRSD